MRRWAVAVVTLVGVVALVSWARRPPAPVPAEASPTVFSEARAAPLLRLLAVEIGSRPQRSAEADRVAEVLVQRLQALPGFEVQVQDAKGALVGPERAFAYEVRNVLARLPGREPGAAVLISAHYDSHADAPGAGDNGVAVAAAFEVARALSAGPRPRHAVVFNFNGTEEYGLVGADAFLQHPWAREVQAVLNLDSAGPAGKSLLFRATNDASGLLETYANAVPWPFGSVVGEDLFRARLVPSDTDFRVYSDRGLRSLDMAFIEDGYAYHTRLDTLERVTPGSLQHVGDNILALARALAEGPLPPSPEPGPFLYYDLLGVVMFVYSARTALVLAGLATLGVLGALFVAWRRGGVTPAAMGWGAGLALAGLLVGLILPAVLALGVSLGLERPHGWFATPVLAWLTFGTMALAGPLGVSAAWMRRATSRGVPEERQALTLWAGGLLVWTLLQGVLVALGVVAAYLASWWLLPGALGLAAACRWPRWRPLLAWAAFLPGALMTAQSGLLLLELFIPIAGRSGPAIPFDPVISTLMALLVTLAALTGLPALLPLRGTGLAVPGLATVGVVFSCVLALTPPYSPERPKRVLLSHADEEAQSRLWVDGGDYLDVQGLLPSLSVQTRNGAPQQHRLPEKPTGRAPPWLEVTPLGTNPDGTRSVSIRWRGEPGERLSLFIPRKGLAGWSLEPALPALPEDERQYTINVLGRPDATWEATLRLRGTAPIPVRFRELDDRLLTPPLEATQAALPPWVNVGTRVMSFKTMSL